MSLIIKNLSPHKIKEIQSADSYNISYGQIKKGSDTQIQLLLEEEGKVLSNATSKHCGCLTFNSVNEGGAIKINIRYNSNLSGQFDKPMNITYREDGQERKLKINVKGVVK